MIIFAIGDDRPKQAKCRAQPANGDAPPVDGLDIGVLVERRFIEHEVIEAGMANGAKGLRYSHLRGELRCRGANGMTPAAIHKAIAAIAFADEAQSQRRPVDELASQRKEPAGITFLQFELELADR